MSANGHAKKPLLQVENLVTRFDIRRGLFGGLTGRVHAVDDITFHIDPEDDAAIDQEGPSSLRPLRPEIEEVVRSAMADPEAPLDLRIHYLRGKVDLEIFTDSVIDEANLRKTLPAINQLRCLKSEI